MVRRVYKYLLLAGLSAWPLSPAGCERGAPEHAATSQPAPAARTPPTPAQQADLQAWVQQTVRPHAPADEHPPVRPRPAETVPTTQSVGLRYTAPPAWQRVPAMTAMRSDQYLLPRAAGDTEDAELRVFYFGPGGSGAVDANVQRWRQQFTGPDGGPVPEADLRREDLEVSGLKVTLIDVTGSFAGAPMRPDAPAPPVKPTYGLLGAIVETPAGPWYFKAVGPAATIAAHRAGFRALVASVRYEPPHTEP